MMFNLLSLKLLIFAPIFAAIVVMSPIFGSNQIYIRRFAKTFATCHFLYSLLFVAFCNFGEGTYYDELTVLGEGWLSKLGVSAAFGIGDFSVLLVVLTSFIFLVALIFSKTIIRTKHKLYYTLLLLLESIILGIFCSKDMFVFLMFWEAELIPTYFLISQWGADKAKKAAMKYIIFSFIGSMFLLVAMIGLYYYGYYLNGELSSSIDFLRIYEADGIYPLMLQKILFMAFLIGFAIKIPVFPVHTWLTEVQSEAPAPISIILAALLQTTGMYGFIRFNLDLFPELFVQYAPNIMILGAITLLWSAFAAYKQGDIKKIAAYSSVSSMGLCLIGLSSLNKIGIDGAIYVILAHTFIVTGLFLIVGLIQQATKTKSLQEISGLGKSMPRLMFASCVIMLSIIGIPFTMGFTGKFLTFIGAFSADFENALLPKIVTLISVFSLVLTSVYMIRFYHSVFCSYPSPIKKFNDISGHRLMLVTVVALCLLIFGCYPHSLMDIYSNLVETLLDVLRV